MAMVGLFWIAGGDVYVGAKPSGQAPGIRLAPEGVVALGDGQAGLYPWEDVHGLTVVDVPVKTLKRQVGAVTDMALGTVMDLALTGPGPGLPGQAPSLLTVRIASTGGNRELSAYVAAAIGYSRTETDLSLALLSRLTEGAATMATTLAAMAEWGRTWEGGGSPRRAEREALLRGWVG
ncbi:hypothetical protein GCM10010218_29100 [Streptomyces mashuensis]|uniref:Uncharacterized protein n=1 Tax=Streptomyces mashuensis TaxID=33904 RepID=A0A919B2P2_9ACTN|nr:hypothetical protein [Streptomyces mashuensis]GHF46043.1 hypothetical protein GCM10010218_29100 [Streptomyces mashuensis]